MLWQTTTIEPAGTEKLGEGLGKLLAPPAVLELRSDLGGGKTTFVRGLVRGVGSKDKVVSPSFTVSRIYKGPSLEIHHFDFYRLHEPGIVADQLDESLQNPRVITIVEWSDIVQGILPEGRLVVELIPTTKSPDERLIKIGYPEAKEAIIKQLQSRLTELKP